VTAAAERTLKPGDPAPDLRQCPECGHDKVAAAFEYADMVAAETRRWLAAWRDGRASRDRDVADAYERGYVDGIGAVKRIEHGLVGAFRVLAPEARWTVRGQARTRRTFGMPHPRDFRGRGGEAA
jgi:hypothetical protein